VPLVFLKKIIILSMKSNQIVELFLMFKKKTFSINHIYFFLLINELTKQQSTQKQNHMRSTKTNSLKKIIQFIYINTRKISWKTFKIKVIFIIFFLGYNDEENEGGHEINKENQVS
jgi:hypothetical protein